MKALPHIQTRKQSLWSLTILATLLLWGCERQSPHTIEQQFYVFGTLINLSFYDVSPALAERAGQEVQQMFQRMHDDWHAWQRGALTDLNQALAEGRSFKVNPGLIPLLNISKTASQMSGDLFNPAIGKLVALWGFHSSEMPSGPIPSAENIAELVAAKPSMADLDIDQDGVVHCRNRAVQLDFGGVAKGYAIDLASARLRALGVHHAIINTGGGLGILGRHGDRPWRIGIRHPLGPGVIASLAVHDGEHIHTSGNYERFREYQGQRYSHIMDPRSGWPVQEIVSVTVIHNQGALADAFTKPLIIEGTDHWYATARRLGIKSAMLVDRQGRVYLDETMRQRIEWTAPPPELFVSPSLN